MSRRPAPPLVLRPGDRKRLEELSTGDDVLAQRARIVLLAAQGRANTAIAARAGVSRQSVLTWRGRYEAEGVDGLVDQARTGRPARTEPWDIVAATWEEAVGEGAQGRWTSRALADRLSLSAATVSRAWRAHRVRPLPRGRFELRTSPAMEVGPVEVVGIAVGGGEGVMALRPRDVEELAAGDGVVDDQSDSVRETVLDLRDRLGAAMGVHVGPGVLDRFATAHGDLLLVATPGVLAPQAHRAADAEEWMAVATVLLGRHAHDGGDLPAVDGLGSFVWTVRENSQGTYDPLPESGPASGQSSGANQVTMREVAAHAGVSIKTVSNVLTGAKRVGEQTRSRVEQAIEVLGYQVNTAARHLRTGRRGSVVLAVPELRVSYYVELAEELIDAAAERGVSILVQTTRGRRDREVEIAAAARGLADGVIIAAQGMTRADLQDVRAGGPLVLIGEYVDGATVDHITISNEEASRTAMEHLLASGRRRVALLGVGTSHVSDARVRGCRAAADAAGVPIEPELLIPSRIWHRDAAEEAVSELIERGGEFDGLVCFNDDLAVGAVRALHTHGVRIPDDVAVVGFDNTKEAAYSTPSITSIAPDMAHIARRALEQIEARQQGQLGGPVQMTAPYTLAIRESAP